MSANMTQKLKRVIPGEMPRVPPNLCLIKITLYVRCEELGEPDSQPACLFSAVTLSQLDPANGATPSSSNAMRGQTWRGCPPVLQMRDFIAFWISPRLFNDGFSPFALTGYSLYALHGPKYGWKTSSTRERPYFLAKWKDLLFT